MRSWQAGLAACIIGVVAAGSVQAGGGAHRIGGGVNYWTAVDDIDWDNIDDTGFGYVASYQYKPGMLGIGVDAELLPDRFGEDSFAPQAYLLLGSAIYAGAGIGVIYADSDFADDPFFSLRAGLDLELLPVLHLDVYGQYRFEDSEELGDSDTNIDKDTINLGAAVRFAL